MRIEVRCCCDPGVLLGWIEAPNAERPFVFTTLSVSGIPLCETFEELKAHVSVEAVVLHVGEVALSGGQFGRRCFNSNDTPIETLRKIPQFTEAPQRRVF